MDYLYLCHKCGEEIPPISKRYRHCVKCITREPMVDALMRVAKVLRTEGPQRLSENQIRLVRETAIGKRLLGEWHRKISRKVLG